MRIYLIILLVFISLSAIGQNKQLLYNFDDLPQNLMSNPGAETSFDMHLGVPFFSQLHFSAGSSGITLYDIFQEGGNINDRIDNSLYKLTNRDFFTVNQQLEIFSIGWRDNKRRYYTAGIYQELDAFLYFPKDVADLAFEGNKDHLRRDFSFSELAFTADMLTVFHVGMTNYFSEDLNYGFRAKIYSGIFNAESVGNRGIFRTIPTPEGDNVYRHFMTGVDVLINTSGWNSLVNEEDGSGQKPLYDLAGKALFGGNLGMGVDAGFTWYLSDQYRVTGSILDIGFMYHYKDVESYRYHGDYETDGIELIFPGPGETRPRYWDDWEDDLDRHLVDETLHNSYVTWRPVKINASLDYGFDEDAEPCNCYVPMGRRRYYNYLSAHFFTMYRPKGFVNALTLSYDRKINDQFRGKISYTADAYSYTNIGFLISGRFSNFNVYLAADNIFSYYNLANAHNASLQLGFQFLLNRN